jgi:hypothetical protein
MLVGVGGEMAADPFAGDGPEARCSAAHGLAGIDAFGEDAPGIGAAGAGLGERDFRPGAEGEALLLAVEAILHAPELGAGGMDLDVEAEAVEEAEGLGAGLGGADRGVAERADGSGHDQGGDAPSGPSWPRGSP